MLGAGDQYQLLIAQRHAIQPGKARWPVHKSSIQGVVQQPFKQLAAGCCTHLQVHLRVSLVIARQQRRQVGRRRAVHGPQHEVPSRLTATHGAQRFVAQGGHTVGIVQQHLACWRQLQALAFAQEQFDAQLLLELAQARGKV
ncbi:hypothetical protein D3C71_1486440 [compost metagenome]